MLNLKDTVKILPIAATFLLTSCLESQKPLIDDSKLIDPFGRDFQVSYSYADLPVIPNGKWFNSMSRNGNMLSVAFVSPEFMQETPKFSYSIAMYEWTKLQHYNYELLRFNKDEGSVYRCRTNKGTVESKYSLYKAVENE
ncbi:hypothetical protein [uncultured Paraglaciecola sp.]|uniref:hypothetical protein n=1 Tax=uncultured Paraglaciecola sp. TaxID=1765024 RepID=UPI0030D80759|tara:strand:- start:372424 stop:372843 length:420 start_codon:yes stop_codon:yes gene_type:complete